jgi:hypothetical protein
MSGSRSFTSRFVTVEVIGSSSRAQDERSVTLDCCLVPARYAVFLARNGAGEGNRTLDIQLGKLSFYH